MQPFQGCELLRAVTQGSADGATLGWMIRILSGFIRRPCRGGDSFGWGVFRGCYPRLHSGKPPAWGNRVAK